MNDKKLLIANRISFILFCLYLLTYVFLPIIEKNANYLWFLIFPVAFLISLIINLSIKYNAMKSSSMEKTSKVVSILNILFNGINLHTVSGSLYTGTADWSAKEEEIKKYPSITPTWSFLLLFVTAFFNFAFGLMLSTPDANFPAVISREVITTFTIISMVFILLMLISSTFSLLYNNGKKETLRFWRTIIIIVIGLIVIAIYSAYHEGFSFKNAIQKKQEKETFEKHKQNIERVLNNN